LSSIEYAVKIILSRIGKPSGEVQVNIQSIKSEQVQFLRNQDVFSTSVRGVTTRTDTGTFSGDSTHTLANAPTTVKNVRSVTRGTLLVYGVDYTVNFLTGVISFTTAQTGSYTIIYDNGPDSIHPDFPRGDLSIGAYPRMALDILNVSMDNFGIGGSKFISNVAFTVVVYANKSNDIDGYIQTIKDAYISNAKSFYYLKFIKPTLIGPTINSPDKKDEIMQKNIDLLGMFEVDSA